MNLEKMNARSAVLVTPSDASNIPTGCFALYIGGGGNVRVTTVMNQDIVFTAVPTGFYLNVQCLKVWATNTTATAIIALS